jgi:hypothetical protein
MRFVSELIAETCQRFPLRTEFICAAGSSTCSSRAWSPSTKPVQHFAELADFDRLRPGGANSGQAVRAVVFGIWRIGNP